MERSYLRLGEQKGQLGLHLVSPEGQVFFLYDGPLLSMWNNRDHYILVKHRNRDDREAIGYHPGQVLGALEEGEGIVKILLFFGARGRDMEINLETKELENVVARQVYGLPPEELEVCVEALDVARRNRVKFDELMQVGRAMALFKR